MSAYSDIIAQVVEWTNKPRLVNEMASAFKQSVRKAHKAAAFYRDLKVAPVTGVVVESVQSIDLDTVAPQYRQLAYVLHPSVPRPFTPVSVLDTTDPDGYYKLDVIYAVGSVLNIRAAVPADSYTLGYYAIPSLTDLDAYSDWITTHHDDVLVLGTAASILALVGEQEIKTRVEALYQAAIRDLIADNLEVIGR